MLQNAYLLAKIGADTAENEHHFAEILPIGHRVAVPPWTASGTWDDGHAGARQGARVAVPEEGDAQLDDSAELFGHETSLFWSLF